MISNELILFFSALAVVVVTVYFVFKNYKKAEQNRISSLPAEIKNELQKTDTEADKATEKGIEKETEKETEKESSKTLKEALKETEKNFWGRIEKIFSGTTVLQAQKTIEEIEEILYTSDLGPTTVQRLLGTVESELSTQEKTNPENVKNILRKEFETIFSGSSSGSTKSNEDIFANFQFSESPSVWLIVGVNGAGKTTTIGKLAAHFANNKKKVLVAAGDTFRAAAEAQLKAWTDRAQVEIFSPPGVKDPSAVAFDAIQKGKANGFDIIIIDTAGRLHTQQNLMEELKKLKRVMAKVSPTFPNETLIVLDANSGQNALIQAKEFNQAIGLSGVILTKMDGTAKGGVAVGLACELKLPIRLIGVGEKIGDLRPFSSKEFIDSIL